MTALDGKVVLITGASKGIGSELALAFGRAGATVIAHYGQDREGAEAVLRRLAQISERPHSIAAANLSSVEQIETTFASVREQYGRLDGLVNNAAITAWTEVFSVTAEEWDRVLDTNLRGTFFCAREAARIMSDQGGGSIVNVSTNVAALGVKNLLAYAVSKGAIHALTRQLAVELAPKGIRVNAFAPGPTNVERNLADDPDYAKTWGSVVPMGRTADPGEMAGTAVYLASDDSSFVTGQLIYVDGGWSVAGHMPPHEADAATSELEPRSRSDPRPGSAARRQSR